MTTLLKEQAVSENERQFIIAGLKDGIRTDARGLDTSRRTIVTFDDQWGTVQVQMGQTRVLASISSEVVEPFADRPNEGYLVFNVDFSPMASPYFETSKPSLKTVEIGRLVERCVKDAGAVDTETLCIISGSRVWSLRVDLHVLNYDGNMTDCCSLAAVCALAYFRRPDITVTSTGVTVHTELERNYIPLQLHFMPITSTFCVFEGVDDAIVDPGLLEDLTCDGHLTIAMNAQKDICCMQKPGGLAMEHDSITMCIQRAYQRTSNLTKYIKDTLEKKLLSKQHKIGNGLERK